MPTPQIPAKAPSRLQLLIAQSSFIPDQDKSFLMSKLSEMAPLDKLSLEQLLMVGKIPESLSEINKIRNLFLSKENSPKPSDAITKFIQRIVPPPPKTLLSQSILVKPNFSGSAVTQAIVPNPIPSTIPNLNEFSNLNQLITLNPAHVTFGVNDPVEQILHNFFVKLDSLFTPIADMVVRRGYLMAYMQSILFSTYLSTGVTAIRHPELQPRTVALNQMHQIDNRKYLNKTQFQYTAELTAHIRSLCGL